MRALRKRDHARCIGAETIAMRAAVRAPGCPPCPGARSVGTWAATTRSATCRPGNRSTGRPSRKAAPAPPTLRTGPGYPACNALRRDPPRPDRSKRFHWARRSRRVARRGLLPPHGQISPPWDYGVRMILPVVARPASWRCASAASDRLNWCSTRSFSSPDFTQPRTAPARCSNSSRFLV